MEKTWTTTDSLLGSLSLVDDGGGGMHKFMFALISSLVVFNFLLRLVLGLK